MWPPGHQCAEKPVPILRPGSLPFSPSKHDILRFWDRQIFPHQFFGKIQDLSPCSWQWSTPRCQPQLPLKKNTFDLLDKSSSSPPSRREHGGGSGMLCEPQIAHTGARLSQALFLPGGLFRGVSYPGLPGGPYPAGPHPGDARWSLTPCPLLLSLFCSSGLFPGSLGLQGWTDLSPKKSFTSHRLSNLIWPQTNSEVEALTWDIIITIIADASHQVMFSSSPWDLKLWVTILSICLSPPVHHQQDWLPFSCPAPPPWSSWWAGVWWWLWRRWCCCCWGWP